MTAHRLSATVTLLFLIEAGEAFADFIPLGDLPDGRFWSDVRGVSADGMVAVGQSNSAFGFETFRWTQAGGMVGLGALPGGAGASIAADTSADGAVVVGISDSPLAFVAEGYRWTQAGGMVGVGLLPGGRNSFVNGVSADGRVVVGMADDQLRFQATRWTQESGLVSLGADLQTAYAASADGSVIVGQNWENRAFRWTDQAVTDLGTLSGSVGNSIAYDASADGSVLVGFSTAAGGSEPYRWTEATGMVGLGHLPGHTTGVAYGVSADGSVITGATSTVFASDQRAFIWDATHGMRDLREVLISQGDDLSGWTLTDARGISADGRVIVGHGINPSGQDESWWARLSGPVRVSIDIKPGSDANPVNPRSHGRIAVAILTTETFDATTVNAATILFGATGTEAAFVKAVLVDVNGDGSRDLLLHFDTQDTGIQCGASSALVKGETLGAEPIEGSDSIKTVGCQ